MLGQVCISYSNLVQKWCSFLVCCFVDFQTMMRIKKVGVLYVQIKLPLADKMANLRKSPRNMLTVIVHITSLVILCQAGLWLLFKNHQKTNHN